MLALDDSKAIQGNSMTNKVIKNNSDIFSKSFQANLNNAIETSTFPEKLKCADVKPISKNDSLIDNKTIDQSVFSLMHLRFEKGVSTSNWRNILRHCYVRAVWFSGGL